MFCQKCGTEINDFAVICVHCGKKISAHPSSTPIVKKEADGCTSFLAIIGILAIVGVGALFISGPSLSDYSSPSNYHDASSSPTNSEMLEKIETKGHWGKLFTEACSFYNATRSVRQHSNGRYRVTIEGTMIMSPVHSSHVKFEYFCDDDGDIIRSMGCSAELDGKPTSTETLMNALLGLGKMNMGM